MSDPCDNPEKAQKTKVFAARYESLAAIDTFVTQNAEDVGFEARAVYQMRMAVDEASTNIIEHAYEGVDDGEIECTCRVDDEDLIIILRDHGVRFDPGSVPSPDLTSDLEDRQLGGLGLFFIRKLMDDVKFEFTVDVGNVVTMVKRKTAKS